MTKMETSFQSATLSAEYTILRELGKGSFGTVHLAMKRNQNQVALKVLPKSIRATSEADLHFRLDHENVISLFESFQIGDFLVMVLEYAELGNLFQYVRSKTHLGDMHAREIFKDIVDGLQYLHSHSIVHVDLKPNNILIDRYFTAKIADFGHARCLEAKHEEKQQNNSVSQTKMSPETDGKVKTFGIDDSKRTRQDLENTDCIPIPSINPNTASKSTSSNRPTKDSSEEYHISYPSEDSFNDKWVDDEYFPVSSAYSAPEVLDSRTYNPLIADIWSLGVMLFYMVSGYLPFGCQDLDSVREAMNKPLRWPRPLSCGVAKTCRRLVEGILMVEPSRRVTLDDIRIHPWIMQ